MGKKIMDQKTSEKFSNTWSNNSRHLFGAQLLPTEKNI